MFWTVSKDKLYMICISHLLLLVKMFLLSGISSASNYSGRKGLPVLAMTKDVM